MVTPRVHNMSILSLGYSPGTQGKILEAPVLVVHDFNELKARAKEVKGKIVLYNYQWKSSLNYSYPVKSQDIYEELVAYRENGAAEASKLGAVAVLVRSLTSYSLSSPHAGMETLDPAVKSISAMSVTVEDAEMIDRMVKRNGEVPLEFR